MVLLQPIHLVSAHPNLRSPAQGEATPPPARPCGTDPPHGRHIKIRQVQKCRHGRQAPCHDIHGYDFDDVLIDTGYGVENTLDQQQHQIAPLNHHGRSEAASAGAPVQATSEDWLRNMPHTILTISPSRTRRVKCDETKPECLRCTKSGRKCGGYKHAAKHRDGSPAAAASFRNPSFLVVPQRPRPTSVPRNPSRSLSPEAAENRSFHYFQTHTLPQWTEFFDSDLWSQKILQLSHIEPAIKHGILALSTLHERFENSTPIFNAGNSDFAFLQYMQAVKHSNDLLTAHQAGRVDVEKILIACIIFTCYENLAGNYRAANMHLRNGLRILCQHRQDVLLHARGPPVNESIASVLFRFDLQAMTFSDNASPYDYSIDCPPECPIIPVAYTSVSQARNDLVGLLRCMMWIAGVANINPRATENPTWLHIYTQLMASMDAFELTFDHFQAFLPMSGAPIDAKTQAGCSLIKIYYLMARTIVAAGASPVRNELSWDPFVGQFKTIVDLAETLPALVKPPCPPTTTTTNSKNNNDLRSRSNSTRSSASPPHALSPIPSPFQTGRPIAPRPGTSTPSPPPGCSTLNFLSEPQPPHHHHPHPHPHPHHPHGPPSQTTTPLPSPSVSSLPSTSPPLTPKPPATKPASKKRPPAFTPSFELSPIVPLFVTACRCRDPIIRRRAISLLLTCRRREGVWDSYGAGMVALQVVKLEEGIGEMVELDEGGWLPLSNNTNAGVEGCGFAGGSAGGGGGEMGSGGGFAHIREEKRVVDVFVSVSVGERQIGVNYLMGSGESVDRYVRF